MTTNIDKTIVEEALTIKRAKLFWTIIYHPAFPITPKDYDIGALLPAMLYMARWGHRRGKGNFIDTFGDGKSQPPTITDVVHGLLDQKNLAISGFNDDVGQMMLGDLLLAWCLENKKHAEGHKEQVQRIYATHYLASWVDLPNRVSHLRGVPELLTGLLANQNKSEWLEVGGSQSRFPVGVAHTENALLNLFAKNMSIRGSYVTDKGSDTFVEETAKDVGIDELLAVRLAQACVGAPLKAKGKDESERIPNRHPIANAAAASLREDLAIFIEVYGESIPRQAFLQMLEAGIGLGLMNLTLSTLNVLLHWEQKGYLPETHEQRSWALFVDASQGQDQKLRELSETVMTETVRCYSRFPYLMMLLRVLDDRVRTDRELGDQLPPTFPDSSAFLNLLGEIYKERHCRAKWILEKLHEDCQNLADELETADEASEIVLKLRDRRASSALLLAEALCDLMGYEKQQQSYLTSLESALMPNRPNGLAIKRKVRRSQNGIQQPQNLLSIVLTPPLLDFLVHRHLRKAAKGKPEKVLSFQEFLKILRERYGLYVDKEPPGQPISQESLLDNKVQLELRLRDLGLLIGVNDAESMKRLKPRYK